MAGALFRVVWKQQVLTPAECATLRAVAQPWTSAHVTDGAGGKTAAGGKRAEWTMLPLGEEYQWLFERLAEFLGERADYGFELRELGSPLKLQRYGPGDFHAWHADLGDPEGQERKLGISVQLSEPGEYDGGDLRFYDPPNHRAGPREQGCAIAFPSYLPHEVAPVTRGMRYALTAWALGPPFR